jgi:DNA polymerase-3 subunit gamma/tau
VPAEDLQLYYQIALIGKRDLHLAPSQRAGFEMALLRMATFRPAEAATPAGGAGPSSGGGAAKARETAAKAAAAPTRRTGPARSSETGKAEAGGHDGHAAGAGVRPATVRGPGHGPAAHGGSAAVGAPAPAGRGRVSAPALRSSVPGGGGPRAGSAAAGGAVMAAAVAVAQETSPAPAFVDAPMPVVDEAPVPVVPERARDGVALPTDQAGWNALVGRLRLRGGARQLAGSCHLDGCDGDLLRLTLDSARQHLYTDTLRDKLVQALSAHCGRPLRVQVEVGEPGSETLAQRHDREAAERQQAAVEQIAKDPCVAALKETFGATVDPDSIRPR